MAALYVEKKLKIQQFDPRNQCLNEAGGIWKDW